MSTKIHNGYKISVSGINDVMALLDAVVVDYDRVVPDLVAKQVALLFANEYDYLVFLQRREDAAKLTVTKFYGEIVERQQKVNTSGRRDPACDYGFEIAIFPGGYKYKDTLALAYVERKELLELFTSRPEVSEFAYWDNTDRPDGITDEAWEERGKAWDAVCPDIPGRAGLTRTISTYIPWVKRESVAAALPGDAARINAVAERSVVEEFFNAAKHMSNAENPVLTGALMSDARKLLRDDFVMTNARAIAAKTLTLRHDLAAALKQV